jgi:hypothetical protein
MSSKKQLRRKRRQEKAAARSQGFNPARAFILVVIVVFVLVGVIATLRGTDREPPPWPGAVWSEEHGHWH